MFDFLFKSLGLEKQDVEDGLRKINEYHDLLETLRLGQIEQQRKIDNLSAKIDELIHILREETV